MVTFRAVGSLECIPDQSDVRVSDQLGALSFHRDEVCTDPFCHHHNERLISHVHPIAAANKLIRGVPDKGTIGIDG